MDDADAPRSADGGLPEAGQDPLGALRKWHARFQELSGGGDAARTFGDAVWRRAERARFADADQRARFFNGLGACFGSPGPAADLRRARRCFSIALGIWREAGDARARALHNLGSAISALGTERAELREAMEAFEEALEWRSEDREIARAVTLHNLGLAHARMARLDPERSPGHLRAAADALSSSLEIRDRLPLPRSAAMTRLQLGLVRKLAGDGPDADELLEGAARELDALGFSREATRAREAARESR
jgi:tetratricopeptide (TPR) repeat protein